MVKMTTKISTHVLKLLHDVNKGEVALNEEEGAEEEEGRKEGATSEGSIWGYFVASCTALLQIDSLLMAPMT